MKQKKNKIELLAPKNRLNFDQFWRENSNVLKRYRNVSIMYWSINSLYVFQRPLIIPLQTGSNIFKPISVITLQAQPIQFPDFPATHPKVFASNPMPHSIIAGIN